MRDLLAATAPEDDDFQFWTLQIYRSAASSVPAPISTANSPLRLSRSRDPDRRSGSERDLQGRRCQGMGARKGAASGPQCGAELKIGGRPRGRPRKHPASSQQTDAR